MNREGGVAPLVRRLLICLGGSVVLAMMVGPQQGSRSDYGLGFRESVLNLRIVYFLLVGVLLFVAVTYREVVSRYVRRPGIRPLLAGVLVLLAAYFLMRWYDPLGDNGKFSGFSDAVSQTPAIAPLARAFFGWLWWVGLAVAVVGVFVAIARRLRWLGWASAGFSVVVGVIALVAHSAATSYAGGIDHSFGSQTAFIGHLILAAAGVIAARSDSEVATTRDFVERVMGYRPGLPLVAMGLVLGVLALVTATWYGPSGKNLTLSATQGLFQGSSASGLAQTYLTWLVYVLFVITLALGAAAVWTRRRPLGLTTAVVAAVSVLLTVDTLYELSSAAAKAGDGGATGPWQNLGTGGWLLSIALFSIGAGGFVAARLADRPAGSELVGASSGRLHQMGASTTMISLALFGVGLALFYPPTATPFWQQALVTDIGVYVLLAVGLNVVIGWAGLLDLGYIAFYAIGSYVTAYLTGSLPVRPPSWLHLSPLWAIPFAIAACLIAGVLLGAPTLRLRGDYLAIVTLGFGEIIRITAVNNPGNFTNGPRGVFKQVPHPVVDLGFIRFEWGANALQYWYLLLVLLAIVVFLFHRLEGSRLGRAWAAVREDEIAAQATGVNTTRVKLLAFAIGASTSGLAGVFFASQVGYFNPQNFVLNNSILIVAYVVFGGMGSLPGAIAGAAALTWLPDFLRDQVPSEDRIMWIGAVLMIMMIFRPEGLIPARRRRAELTGLAGHDTNVSQGLQAIPAGEGV
ncbi:MAG: branched-chain amino acid transporter permease [Variovorax sp.]|nr:branched-chain amino acid transporter permease [Variovorax sp.]